MEISDGTHPDGLAHWRATRTSAIADYTVGAALRKAAAQWPDAVALVEGLPTESERRRWTFSSLLSVSEQVAKALLGRFAPGHHVAIWAPNCPEWLMIEFGAALAGITIVTVNPALLAQEVLYVLKQSRACGLVLVPEYRGHDLIALVDEVRGELPLLREVISIFAWDRFVDSAASGTPLPHVRGSDVAQIQYTSGTTGFPKGAELTHRGIANNGRLYAEVIGARPGDVWLNPMPMFHTAGCGLATMGALQTGGTHVLPNVFDATLVFDLIESERATVMLGVPTMFIRLLEEVAVRGRRPSSMRLVTMGGAPVPLELVRRIEAALGVEVGIGFGLTEASPYITHTRSGEMASRSEVTVGRPMPGIEMRIADVVSGQTLPIGAAGEIQTRSGCVMNGYFDNPEATRNAIDPEGWLRTGDLGSMAEGGFLSIQGRLKDIIIRGGENVYPREIEDLLFAHPAVVSASVLGVPDPEWGEVVAAFVKLRPAAVVSPTDLEHFCRKELASYKVPRIWRFVDEFPQTASGKIQKFVLRDRLMQESKASLGDGPSAASAP